MMSTTQNTIMRQPNKWDYRFMEIAKLVATWSKDPNTKVGSCIVKDRKILSTGYNGFPRGLSDTLEQYSDRKFKLDHVVHAETNAIYNSPIQPKGCTIYCTFAPCLNCSLAIIQAGITEVVCPTIFPGRWESLQSHAQEYMKEGGLAIVEILEPDYII